MSSSTDTSSWLPALLAQLREQIRYRHYSLRTEQAYEHWVRAFARFHGEARHPRTFGREEIEGFLSWLASERQVSPNTHKQALSALLFLYQQVLGQQLPWLGELGRPKRQVRLPVVLTHDEVSRLLRALETDEQRLFGRLLYGTGMRLMEGLRLRVKDVDFTRRVIVVREGKGAKDRVVMLPAALERPLPAQLAKARQLWQADRDAGLAGVYLPHALARKYPRAAESWAWAWVFPQATRSVDPRTGEQRRHHLFEQSFQRALKRAVQAAGIGKPATPHTLRHYSESRNMPRHPGCWSREAGGKAGRTRGIFSLATLRGVTGDDRDSDIRGSAASGGRGRVLGVGAYVFRADAVSWVRA
ncbi:MAG: integron integrase [Burkholderiales bacterium]|nr:integron integrase [Burkholderiales bacterium]